MKTMKSYNREFKHLTILFIPCRSLFIPYRTYLPCWKIHEKPVSGVL